MAKIRKIKEKELVGGTSNTEVYPITHARAVYDKNNTPLSDTLEFLNTEIVWNNSSTLSNMNDFVVAGVYDIKGDRTRVNDNLPILNTGGGHSFNARLTVLDSSITGDGKNDDKCITQVLSFSNRLGQGEVYIRTGKGSSLDNLTWDKWSTLQRNVNVGQVDNLDNLKDNGIYSGVWTKGSYNAYPITFVCVVINDYFIGTAPRRISQFVYGLSKFDGSVVYQSRVWDDSKNAWSDWEILNQKEIAKMISDEIKKVTDGIDPEKIDSIKDIVDWIDAHGGDVTAIYNAIQQNTVKINAEISRAKEAEQAINDKLDEEVGRAEQTEQAIDDKIDEEVRRATEAEGEINQNTIAADSLGCSTTTDDISIEYETLDGKSSGSVTIPAATTSTAGVMTAEDKKNLDNVPSTIEDAIAKESKATDEKIAKEKDALVNGDTIVGQAREIHSRNGKTVTDSFLARTTAGSGTIGGGVASLKSVGGNIVKNLVDGTFESGWETLGSTVAINDGIVVCTTSMTYGRYRFPINRISGHKYYASTLVNGFGNLIQVVISRAYIADANINKNGWTQISYVTNDSSPDSFFYISCAKSGHTFCATKPLLVDLTEMFGAGNEPDKATCDKLFATMDALPQGLTIANPTEFKSTGFNQFNPDNVLVDKAIVDGAIVDGDKNIAVIPCLPCKIGVGENNGYCIHGEFGEDINVYLTPLNPKDVEGELYMHKLTKDATTDTYVPLIKGYMLVEVPTTVNLCCHFLWGEDRDKHDYEPYHESKVALPTIPQMREWGLAGIQSSGTLACDEIDFERGVYVKRIKKVYIDVFRIYQKDNNVYELEFIQSDNINKRSVLCPAYATDKAGGVSATKPDKCIYPSNISIHNRFYIVDSSIADAASLKEAMKDVPIYVELATPEEYPLPKVDNNYISSDYGVEQFDSVVPCNANNLYYMRSLAGETRNFLDRMYDNTAKADAKEVADYITNGIEGNKELATNAPNLALRALFVAAGAEYNDTEVDKTKTAVWGETVTHKAGHYYLNGLGDITEKQMLAIYNRGVFNDSEKAPFGNAPTARFNNIRTNLCRVGMWNCSLLSYLCVSNKMIEVVNLYITNNDNIKEACFVSFSDTESLFNGASNLSVIDTRCILKSATWKSTAFTGCKKLKELKITSLGNNIVFKDSPLLSKATVLYMIQKSTTTSAITITLHADAYARLANDADIVAALEAQPLITLVSA